MQVAMTLGDLPAVPRAQMGERLQVALLLVGHAILSSSAARSARSRLLLVATEQEPGSLARRAMFDRRKPTSCARSWI